MIYGGTGKRTLKKMTDNESVVHFRVVRFIYEAGLKLRMKTLSLASACVLYHRCFRENRLEDFDPYLVASACIYIACKSEEEGQVSLRDIINVAYRTLHRDKPPLEMGDKYNSYRESVINCELYILRSLQFKAVVYHPHKFLLHYLKFIQDWFDPFIWQSVPITRTCWSILRDSYHSNLALRYRPQHIAIAIIYFAFLSHGIEVPHSKSADLAWWKVFKEDISLNEIKDIINEIVYTYEMENTLHSS